jgi:hypothetical protein
MHPQGFDLPNCLCTSHTWAMPNQRKTPGRFVAMDAQLWDDLGQVAELDGTDRSAILRELARAHVARRRRQLERQARAAEAAPAAGQP